MIKIGALLHFYPPWRNAGSETVAVEMLTAAVRAGHNVTVWCTHETAERVWRGIRPPTDVDGVTVYRVGNPIMAAKAMARTRPDVVFSHHQHATQAIKTAQQIGARSVFTVHNDMDINKRPLMARPDLVVFNSEWVKKSLARFGEPNGSMVMYPPLTPHRHKVESTGDAFTLVNLNEHKGALVLYELAGRMPDKKFIGVIGGHGQQVIRRNIPNVEILDHGPDMTRVWSRTRALLMPSIYESYGLVAVEAAVNGIPTIAHPTPGLRENLGAGGLFADRDNINAWIRRITELDDPTAYEKASVYASGLADTAMKRTSDTLKDWCDWLEASA